MKVLESLFRKLCEKLKEDECLPDHIRKVYENMEISPEQLEITLNELTPLVKHAMTLIVIFNIVFICRPLKKLLVKVLPNKIVLC